MKPNKSLTAKKKKKNENQRLLEKLSLIYTQLLILQTKHEILLKYGSIFIFIQCCRLFSCLFILLLSDLTQSTGII